MTEVEYLSLGDFLAIAEQVTGIPAETLLNSARIGLADSAIHAPRAAFGGVEFYPDLETKAAVLCVRLARNHPLPDGNKRTAWACLRMFLKRNRRDWKPDSHDPEMVVEIMLAVAAGAMGEDELAAWLRESLSDG